MRLILVLPLMLAGCVGGLTPRQAMFATYASYDVALEGAVAYANTPTAIPAVVHRMNATNQSAPVKAARVYGRAFVACSGDAKAVVSGVDCSQFNFSPSTAQGYIVTLRAAVTQLVH